MGAAVGLSFPGLALTVSDVAGFVVVLSLFIGSPILLLLGVLFGAGAHRSWLFGLCAGAAVGGLFWLWVLYVRVGPGH
jgi:hypothetical protein